MRFLTVFFFFGALQMDGTVIPWDRLDKTKIYVLKGKARHFPEDERLSVYENYEPLSGVTHGKEAGASHNEY